MSIRSSPVKSEYIGVTYGWFGGGNTGAATDLIDRITLPSDTTNAVYRCDLTVAKYKLASFADSLYGWFGGGNPATNVVERITLADDTTNAIDRCNLMTSRYGLTAFTDNTYGWFGGGFQTGFVDRITLADDTTNAMVRCGLISMVRELSSFENAVYGWFGGGLAGPMTHINIVQRITLSNDTVNALDRCNITLSRHGLAAFSNDTYGWFGGGHYGILISNPYYYTTDIVDRITLADDTTNAIDRCDLSLSRAVISAVTDGIYGWVGGGSKYGGAGPTDTIDRMTIADDTTNAIDRCDITVARYGLAAFSGSV